MEQRWTIDTFDAPSGDLEFWAIRRGEVPQAANQNDHGYVPTRRRNRMIVRTGVAVLMAVAVGVALG